MRIRAAGIILLGIIPLPGVGSALAQPANGPGSARSDPYITSTGETVARPGQSQSGGATPMDRGIQRQDNKIDNSICNGC